MKKLSITKEQFEKSKYFTRKYGKLAFVSESGKLFKTNKGNVLKFTKESTLNDGIANDEEYTFLRVSVAWDVEGDEPPEGLPTSVYIKVPSYIYEGDGEMNLSGMIEDYFGYRVDDIYPSEASNRDKKRVKDWLLWTDDEGLVEDDGLGMRYDESPKKPAELTEDAILDAIPVDARDGLIDINEPDGSFGRYTWYVKFAPFSDEEAKEAADGITKSTGRRTTVAGDGRETYVLIMDYPSRPTSESKKVVKEGAGAGYTVTIKNVKLANAKVINRSEDGDWEFEADIVKDSYMVEAEDYYNRFCPISEYDEEWVEVSGKVYGVCWWYDDESDVERQVNGQEQDIGFDYGGGWTHVNLPKDGHITADRIRSDEHDTWAIQSIELFAPQVSECVNYCHEHFLDEEEGGEEEEVDESKLAKETSDDLTLDEIYKAVKEEYGGKLFSDNFLKLNIEHVSGQVLCIFELDRPDDMGANDGDDEWWEDKKDSAILFYDELVKFLVDKFGEKFRFTDPRVSDEYADKSDPKGAFEIFIDEDDATLPIITIDEVADGWYAESEENENGTIDDWRVFDYGEDFPYTERYTVLDPDGYQFFISHNGGVGSFTEDPLEGTSEEICDELEVEIEDKMWKPMELSKREMLDNITVMKGLRRIKEKYDYDDQD